MILANPPVLLGVVSVSEAGEPGVYVAIVRAEIEGVIDEWHYVSRPDDSFGLAPQVREAIGKWIDDGRPVSREGG